jgi:hypothetical protein
MNEIFISQMAGHNSGYFSAQFQNSIGKGVHQTDVASAIHQVDVVFYQHSAKIFGFTTVNAIISHARTAKYTDGLYHFFDRYFLKTKHSIPGIRGGMFIYYFLHIGKP